MNIRHSPLQAARSALLGPSVHARAVDRAAAREPDTLDPGDLPQHPAGAADSGAPEAVFLRGLLRRRRVFGELQGLQREICAASSLINRTLLDGGRLLLMGNGVSGCTGQQLAAEFNRRLHVVGRRSRAFALGVSAALPAPGARGSVSFEHQLAAYSRAGDCLIGLSVSGDTANVLRAFETARSLGLSSVGLLGRAGCRAQGLVDAAVVTALSDVALVHEAHLFIGHTWCAQTEAALDAGTTAAQLQ